MKSLGSSGPAIGAATGSSGYVTEDIDGETRAAPDVGADEYPAVPALEQGLLGAGDVGPAAP